MHSHDEIQWYELSQDERDAVLRGVAEALEAISEVKLAWVYGSFVRGEPFRDLDLAVVTDGPASWRLLPQIEAAVGARLGRPEIPIDVISMNGAEPGFQVRVMEEGVLVKAGGEGEATDRWVLALSRSLDLRDWARTHGEGA